MTKPFFYQIVRQGHTNYVVRLLASPSNPHVGPDGMSDELLAWFDQTFGIRLGRKEEYDSERFKINIRSDMFYSFVFGDVQDQIIFRLAFA